jgi:WD40 repeat protein
MRWSQLWYPVILLLTLGLHSGCSDDSKTVPTDPTEPLIYPSPSTEIFVPDSTLTPSLFIDASLTPATLDDSEPFATMVYEEGEPLNIAWSPDGASLAVASGLGGQGDVSALTIWNPFTGELLNRLTLASSNFTGTHVSWAQLKGESVIALGGFVHGSDTPTQYRISLFDPRTQRELETIDIPGAIYSLDISSDGRMVAVGSLYDGETLVIDVWDIANGYEKLLFPGDNPATDYLGFVEGLSWSPVDHVLALAGTDGHIVIWNVDDHESIQIIPTASEVNHIEWSPDGTMFATAEIIDHKGVIGIWDVFSGVRLHTLPLSGREVAISFSSDSQLLAIGLELGEVLILDVTKGAPTLMLDTGLVYVSDVEWSPVDPALLAVSNYGSLISLWRIEH